MPSSPTPSPSFREVAPRYDELRPVDESWWEVFDALVREGDLRGRRVLDVGCGTGKFAAALANRAVCRVWGVDASAEMLAIARADVPDVRFKQAQAEQLPFKDGWFERAVLRMSLHLFDRPRALAESRRVLAPGGRVAIATPDPAQLGSSWFDPFFPTLAEVDRQRLPSQEALERELVAAGFGPARVANLVQDKTISRDDALAKLRAKAFSTFQLIPPDEYEAGLERAERGLPETSAYPHRWLIATAEAV
ncbi:MAG: methyltransferase domain-containing protein [Actinomycetota bacterium]|nr:methyltransferase domain-containing protein [Actinomycetota bacterium]